MQMYTKTLIAYLGLGMHVSCMSEVRYNFPLYTYICTSVLIKLLSKYHNCRQRKKKILWTRLAYKQLVSLDIHDPPRIYIGSDPLIAMPQIEEIPDDSHTASLPSTLYPDQWEEGRSGRGGEGGEGRVGREFGEGMGASQKKTGVFFYNYIYRPAPIKRN